MKKITLLLALAVIVFTSCKSKYPNLEDGLYAEFVTNKGTFVAKFYDQATPLTVANFIELAEGTHPLADSIFKGKPYYNGISFHRVIKDFMIQGGDPLGTGTGGPGYKFEDEPITRDYKRGIVAMANSGPDTNGSQFFIMHKDLDLPKNYVIFGQVTEGLETIDKIAEISVTDNGMGEISKPQEEVKIEKIEIVEN